MTNQIVIELWNHGKAGETDKPCGEVSVFNISGENIDLALLKIITNQAEETGQLFEWFGTLPTEDGLRVTANISNYGGEFWLETIGCEILPPLEYKPEG